MIKLSLTFGWKSNNAKLLSCFFIKAWLSLYYIGPVVLGIWFVLYPLVLKPLARVQKIETKDPNENK